MKAAKLAEILNKFPEGSFVNLEKNFLLVANKDGVVQGFLHDGGIFVDTSLAEDAEEFAPIVEQRPD